MKKNLLLSFTLISVFCLTAFIIPGFKMADIMKADPDYKALILYGKTYLNIGNSFSAQPVNTRVIITPSGYVRQDYNFPKAVVTIINSDSRPIILVNNVLLNQNPAVFSTNDLFASILRLYLSKNPLHVFNKMHIDTAKVAYGLANNRAAYIIGSDSIQLFIDNELTVPMMYRIKNGNNYTEAAVVSYLRSAFITDTVSQLPGPGGLSNKGYAEQKMTLPANVELYSSNTLLQKWDFTQAVLLTNDRPIQELILSSWEIRKLKIYSPALSPFILY